jgi:hypothetical protein
LDEALEPCTVLADCLGATPVWLNVGRVVRATVGGVVNVRHGAAYFSDTLPLETDVIGVNEYSGDVIAWHTTTDGGGQAIMLGLAWVHSKHEHTAMLRTLLTRLAGNRGSCAPIPTSGLPCASPENAACSSSSTSTPRRWRPK